LQKKINNDYKIELPCKIFMQLTVHCLIKNEENFIFYAIKSVVDFVDKIIIFDTGSTDKTVAIVNSLVNQYPHKIIFEEKGDCNKSQHTLLRQEMIEKTKTEWFMVLDGDEIWTKRGMEEDEVPVGKQFVGEDLNRFTRGGHLDTDRPLNRGDVIAKFKLVRSPQRQC
jgi:glycosyltransferase involved in cell wall biosynthesis